MPGKPEEPQAPATAAAEATETPKAPDSKERKGRLHASPRVRALSGGAARIALILAFLLFGFLALRYSRGGVAVAPGEEAPPSYSTPGVDPDQLLRMAERLRRSRWQEEAIELPPPPPPAPAPAPPPPPRTIRREKAIFEVPMSPQAGGRSNRNEANRLLEGGSAGEGRLPDFHLPKEEWDRWSALAPGQAGPAERVGFQAGGQNATVLEVHPEARTGLHLRRGSFLPIVLTHAVNTDVPGLIRGHLARDVRDTTGAEVLLPQGTLLIGQQRNALSTGDGRLLIDWNSLHLPDGRAIELPEPQGTAATDGSLGATGTLDRHFGSRFGTALLLGALGATLQLSQPQQSATFGQGASTQQIAAGEVGARLNDLAERTLEERLNRPPTIKIPAGARLQLLLLQDLVFPSPQIPSRRIGREGRDETAGNPPPTPPLRKEGRPLPSPSVLHPSGWHSVAPGVNPGETVGRAATGGRPYTSHAPTGTGGASPLQSPSVLHPSGWHSVSPGVNPGKR